MKKLLFLLIALLVSGVVMAQGSKGKMTKCSFLAFHGGPSFPAGDFGSRNETNDKAGFAKTGFNLNLNYAYLFHPNIGITGSVFYDKNDVDASLITHELPDAKVDHWQFYGVAAGPIFSYEFSKKAVGDIRLMGGVANANSPRFTYANELMLDEEWNTAFVFQGAAGLRIFTGKNFFFLINTDITALKPEFNVLNTDGTLFDRFRQNMTVVNLNGGIGIRF